MKVGVCLKQVPPSGDSLKVSSEGVDLTDVKMEINAYDEFALEEALRLKDSKVASEVIVFSIGGKDVEARMRDGLARGADRAVRIDDAAISAGDNLVQARAIAAAAKDAGCELVLAGMLTIDDDDSQIPAMVAEVLGWPQILVVDKLEIGDGQAKAWRQAGSGTREVVTCALPAVISADKGLNEPRYAKLKGIMMAKRKKIEVKDASALGLDAATLGSQVTVSNYGPPAARPAGRILSGSTAEQVKELVSLLRNEAKVI